MRPVAAVLVPVLAGPLLAAPADADLKELRKQWTKLDREAKVEGLRRLGAHPSGPVVAQAEKWLRDKDPLVRGQVVRLLAISSLDPKLHSRATRAVLGYVDAHLAWRARKEKKEYADVCREFGRKIPEGPATGQGSRYEDPYDEQRRPLPEEIREERRHTGDVIAALEAMVGAETLGALLRVFREHHDPEVLVRAVEAFGKRGDWRALPAMADLLRIQEQGRAMGGGAVIGEEKYRTLRLKWDLHKDRLFWSRPEYVLRVAAPIRTTASALLGVRITSAVQLDRWLLEHARELAEHDVRLTSAFRARAGSSG